MKLTTAGESHGKALVAVIEGLPAHLRIDQAEIERELSLRRRGYGRGERQNTECDQAEIMTGIRHGETLGTPLTICIFNNDTTIETRPARTSVRAGHADLAGAVKFSQTDAEQISERASARETAVRVASGSIFKQFLRLFGVEIKGFVRSVLGVKDENEYAFSDLNGFENSQTGILDAEKDLLAKREIDRVKGVGTTAGGVVEIRVHGLKAGFGSFATYAEKLDARLSFALMSIQSAKGVEIGDGFALCEREGKNAVDKIFSENGRPVRKTNYAGGIEGGMSNGEEIVIRVAVKPVPTQNGFSTTYDLKTGKETQTEYVRSDSCVLYAFTVVAESVVAEVIATAVKERLGGDTVEQAVSRYKEL